MENAGLKVAITNASFAESLEFVGKQQTSGIEINSHADLLSADRGKVLDLVRDADAVVVPSVIAGFPSRGDLEVLPRLKAVAIAASGFEQYDLAAMSDAGVVAFNAPSGKAATSVAEQAVGLMIACLRKWALQISLRESAPRRREIGRLLADSHVAVIGYGEIGRQVVEACQALGAQVTVVSSRAGSIHLPAGVSAVRSVDEVVGEADIVTLHLRLLESNRGMVDGGFLSQMKVGSVLINTARHELVDEKALLVALSDGQLGALGMDDRPQSPELRFHPSVMWLPHIGNRSVGGMTSVAETVFDGLHRIRMGRMPKTYLGFDTSTVP